MAREYCADSGGDGLFKPHWLRYPDALKRGEPSKWFRPFCLRKHMNQKIKVKSYRCDVRAAIYFKSCK